MVAPNPPTPNPLIRPVLLLLLFLIQPTLLQAETFAWKNILDLQALADVEFYISGKQGAGKMLVKDLEFRTK